MYRLRQEEIACPEHGAGYFEGRVWEGNLLQEVAGEPLKIADVHGDGPLSCGCAVSIDWYATDKQPQIAIV